MLDWRIYYGDGSTFDSSQGPPHAAPALNVQAIAQKADPGIGRRTCSRFDFYWYGDDGEWHGGDNFGLWDYLATPGPKVVKFGRVLPRLEFEKILSRAVMDPDLQPKVAWDSHETKSPDDLT